MAYDGRVRRTIRTHKRSVVGVGSWLTDQGFQVNATDWRTRRVSFSGTVGTIRQAFATSIVTDGTNYVNTSDPLVTAELAQYIQAILGLSSMPRVPNSDARQATDHDNSKRELAELLSDETAMAWDRTFRHRFIHLLQRGSGTQRRKQRYRSSGLRWTAGTW